jgi:hypothetical protein
MILGHCASSLCLPSRQPPQKFLGSGRRGGRNELHQSLWKNGCLPYFRSLTFIQCALWWCNEAMSSHRTYRRRGGVSAPFEPFCVDCLLSSGEASALVDTALFSLAKARAMTGFMLSTIAVGIRIVAPRSLVVS